MKVSFQQALDSQLLRSERQRAVIVLSIFVFAVGYQFVNRYLFTIDKETVNVQSLSAIWLFPFTIVLFEAASLFYIDRRIRKTGKKIPVHLQFLNTAFEIIIPSLIIFTVAREYPMYNVMLSPAVYIYFIFIVLSTLRLNFALSFFCGALSSAASIAFSWFLYGHFNTTDAARATIILMTGIAAGLVARQIRAGINKSLNEAHRRQKVEDLFGQQISPEIASRMLENDGEIESKRVVAAIMFIDIRNFTRFAVGKKPEEIVQYQNAFFSLVINTVSQHNGIVNQLLGDGCMVTFGAPMDLENPSQNAVDAAACLLEQLNEAMIAGELPPTKIGIGIHTGEVVSGNIGTTHRQQYSITGSTVILASRIEQLNKQFDSQLLVSEEVAKSINWVGMEHYGSADLKGWHSPMTIYKLA